MTPTYRAWLHMLNRCRNAKTVRFDRWGGRGIKVCDRWKEDCGRGFLNFLADMGEKPKGTSIDRINNDGDYEPGNCRWATRSQQSRNRPDRKLIEWRGERRFLVDWANATGFSMKLLHKRLYRFGWTPERAFTAPVRGRMSSSRS